MKYDPFVFNSLRHKGLNVLWKSIPTSPPVVHFRILINVGARHDPAPHFGLAHFFEHMPFDGCEDFPTPEAVDKYGRTTLLESLNAFTGMDHTVFLCRCKAADALDAATFMSKLVFKPLLLQKEIDREHLVITQEIWRRYENQREIDLHKERRGLLYNNHIFQTMGSAAGFPDSIKGIDREKLLAFHAAEYHKGNVTLLVAGQLDEKLVTEIADAFVARVPEGKTGNPLPQPQYILTTPVTKEHTISRAEYFKLTGDAIPKQTTINYSAISTIEPNEAVRSVAANALENIIHDEIRGKLGATYAIHFERHTYGDHSRLNIHTQINPELVEQAKKIILQAIDDVEALTPKVLPHLDQAKQAMYDRALVNEYSGAKIADIALDDYSIFGAIETQAEGLQKIEAVTHQDISDWVKERKDRFMWFIDTP